MDSTGTVTAGELYEEMMFRNRKVLVLKSSIEQLNKITAKDELMKVIDSLASMVDNEEEQIGKLMEAWLKYTKAIR